MSHSYIAYIDESGDDGLANYREPGADGGASRWLVITACLLRASRDLEVVQWRDEVSANLPNKNSRSFHFKKMNHAQRIMAATILSEKPVSLSHVLSDKTTIQDGVYEEKKPTILLLGAIFNRAPVLAVSRYEAARSRRRRAGQNCLFAQRRNVLSRFPKLFAMAPDRH